MYTWAPKRLYEEMILRIKLKYLQEIMDCS